MSSMYAQERSCGDHTKDAPNVRIPPNTETRLHECGKPSQNSLRTGLSCSYIVFPLSIHHDLGKFATVKLATVSDKRRSVDTSSNSTRPLFETSSFTITTTNRLLPHRRPEDAPTAQAHSCYYLIEASPTITFASPSVFKHSFHPLIHKLVAIPSHNIIRRTV
jgi:hypothetical protein